MRRQWLAITVLGLIALAVSGCTDSAMKAEDMNVQPNAINTPSIGILSANRLPEDTYFQLNDDLSDAVAKLPGVQSAYVMLTDRNAYVAVNRGVTDTHLSGPQLTEDFRASVAETVQSRSPSTENVYVSEDPVWWSRMQVYTHAVREGYPLQQYVSEFKALIEKIFEPSSLK